MTWGDFSAALLARGLVTSSATSVGEGVPVTGVAYDSRRVGPGHVFVALRGQHADGVSFALDAVRRGAVAVVAESSVPHDAQVPWVVVSDARAALAVLSAVYYAYPSASMRVVGVTGTNGKTTTAVLLRSIFEAAGLRCGLVGTIGYRIGAEVREAPRTTPESADLQSLFREMVDRDCAACVMEVSSHALSLKRVDETQFSAGVFTNLTRDHLDFHLDMESYYKAKRRLFAMLPPGAPAVINADDPRGADLAASVSHPVTYGIARAADCTAGPIAYSLAGLAFTIQTPRGPLHVRSSLIGRPNVYNILAAASAACALDIAFDAIAQGIQAVRGVPGRFEVVSAGEDGITVVVDYAHTDDALRNLLETARPLAQGRLITVFGCGGDRDRTKRPLMGAVAGRLSDVIIVTSDNPRSEDPKVIIEEVLRGITPDTRRDAAQRVLTISDRRQAIVRAVELAAPGDVVLIAGKGHEKSQVIGDRVLPFDDTEVARDALGKRRTSSGAA